jgi:GNAT superfamily N-acetyltransferase
LNTILTEFSTPAIQGAIIDNVHEYARLFKPLEAVEVIDTPDTLRLYTPSVPNPFFNAVMNAPLTDDPAATIRQLSEPFMREKLMAFWWGWSCRADFPADVLAQHGYQLMEAQPGMAVDLHALNETSTAPANFRIERVGSDEALNQMLSVIERAFGFDDDLMRTFYDAYRHYDYAPDAPLQHYSGWLDDEPVACATYMLGSGVVGLYNVVVLEDYRRRGLGGAITIKPLQDARERGYRFSVLNASEDGQRLYSRLGYRDYCTVNMYLLLHE